ncbi:1-acyl-sn-glycerol-3-phosphate acyltransferase [Flavipsychrobacter stenotrophus]|uniref:1-acyl-sn-glycerol-3-phosphate acyltransferase n=1 Tax=Flavipsychrobacter stenotrophus TaxID=2077091 RepID=A0A2S7SZ82_9BACT|nr:lysophospholipid acyltransferase family protein [Flavipsychrobacter stenotrophus]PQJ12260.1 1-acyl-sn-glycerol-3-phosphate acyltransferase [Flavipsychrobacter stenotrophus]
MKLIQNILGKIFAVYAALMFVATMLFVLIPVWIISLLPEPRRARVLHPVFRLWMGIYMPLIFCPVTRRGKDKFKKGENYVVILNHNSFMDVPVSSPWIPGPNKTLAKMEMSRIPLFGAIYKAGSILVDRKSDQSRRGSFGKMQETLEQGTNLCLYPEGTRNKGGQPMQQFFDGAFRTAVKAQKPIMPGVIFNTAKVLPATRTFWMRPHPIQIHFLDPIPTTGLTTDDIPALKERLFTIMESYYINHKK